ncbi:aminotransferase class V-fold PLP-dependent enzyme [Mesorhizobium sp. J428]|uniref:aminotransferase class V-fold PLP-dependent enzyme n=1 Tax=Mesorhizobium sp. J428 TaxID=2898440 RepID=UPI0021509804|nr:aminotransferase class V-fold PLP-dependent enzyme [Mesorhizobium sp. J428]MCR5857246.1 aminotransferase class V-fold PLP-dependent enzyme [Mesorhizobium sp. J428]
MSTHTPAELFEKFRVSLGGPEGIAAQLVGEGATIDGPFGPKPLVYADYVASGRALFPVERFILEDVLPYYANSHTEASYCGGFMTRLRNAARAVVAGSCGADERHAVVFSGSGATSGLNRLINLFGLAARAASGRRPCVILGPYEHHSNILPWRESGAEVIEIGEGPEGGPDVEALRHALRRYAGRPTVCAFSAASNITGIVADVAGITGLVKQAGALMVWDYAGGGPYLPVSMCPGKGVEIDAIVLSPHKFIGGPGASGILIVRRDAVSTGRPTWPGGGTVRFVSPESHDYSESLVAREEAGTPNVIGDIRAALAFIVKETIGMELMAARNSALTSRALAALCNIENLELLGKLDAPRLPIFSFRIRGGDSQYVHQQLVTRLLSDRYGIQARGGCACAGPYALRLLDIEADEWRRLRRDILDGNEMAKPGFTRLNLSVLLPEEKIRYILDSVAELAGDAGRHVARYQADTGRAIFSPLSLVA